MFVPVEKGDLVCTGENCRVSVVRGEALEIEAVSTSPNADS